MQTTIEFRKEIKQGRLYDPRHNFELGTIESEIRYDPLTDDSNYRVGMTHNLAVKTNKVGRAHPTELGRYCDSILHE